MVSAVGTVSPSSKIWTRRPFVAATVPPPVPLAVMSPPNLVVEKSAVTVTGEALASEADALRLPAVPYVIVGPAMISHLPVDIGSIAGGTRAHARRPCRDGTSPA